MTWKTVKLKDICLSITDGDHQPPPKAPQGIPFITIANFTNTNQIDFSNLMYVPEEYYKRLDSKRKARKGDILYSVVGSFGIPVRIKENTPFVFQRHIAILRPNEEKVDSRFLFYSVLSPLFFAKADAVAVGAAQRTISLSALRNLDIALPPLETQRKIADVLSAYDDLIENNERQIRLLEEAAQRLYKEWFVRLHFPGYESTPVKDGMPEGWKKDRADAFFQITIGKTPPRSEQKCFTVGEKGVPWVSIADMGNAHTFIAETEEGLTEEAIEKYHVKVIPADTILLSFKLTVGRVAIATSEMCTNEAIAHFRLLHKWQREYVYCYLSAFHYDSLGSTSSISKAINSQMVKAMPFIMPDEKVVREFSKLACPLFEAIYICVAQNKLLQEARDRLLPKLMNGEIEV